MIIQGRLQWRSNMQKFQKSNGEESFFQTIRISTGIDSIYCTVFKEQTAVVNLIEVGDIVTADIKFTARTWHTTEGNERQTTDCTVCRLAKL